MARNRNNEPRAANSAKKVDAHADQMERSCPSPPPQFAAISSRGLNYVRSSLNWGPTIALNRAFKTFGLWYDRRGSFAEAFHTYTLEWTEDFLYGIHLIDSAFISDFVDFAGEFT